MSYFSLANFSKLDIWDILTEPIWFISALIILITICKLYTFYKGKIWIVPIISGLFFLIGTALDAIDEYIIMPDFVGTIFEDIFKMTGYAFFAIGLIIIAYKLIQMSNTDNLTGLNNRRCFFDLINKEIDRAKRDKTIFLMVFIDIDRFKEINDLFGHLAGDEIMKKLALKMQQNIRAVDSIYRFGGDEYIILMPNTKSDTINKVMQRLKKAISEIKLSNNKSLGISYGISQYPDDGPDIDTLLLTASKKMYDIKLK